MKPLLALAALASVVAAAPVPKGAKDKQPNYFPMAVGDKWEYAHPDAPGVVAETREITAAEEKDGAKFFTQKSNTEHAVVMKIDMAGVHVVSSGRSTYDPPFKAVGPDIKAGDSWECIAETGMTRTVGAARKVVTPAGTFTAYPVTVSFEKRPGSAKQVIWYADGVGMVRYDLGDGEAQLVLSKFTPGKEPK